MTGPGRILEVSGETREVGENEQIDFRSVHIYLGFHAVQK